LTEKGVAKDKRSGKIVLVAHCILNQNSRVFGLAEKSGMINEIVRVLMRNNVGVVQMPCPELVYAGLSRAPKTREQYEDLKFRKVCRKIAEELAKQISEYVQHEIKLKVVIGVDGSPSCGVKDSGILIEELRSALDKIGVCAPFYGVSYKRLKEDAHKIDELIRLAV
jgi:predicted secreted protein